VTLSEPMRRTAIFGALFLVCLAAWILQPLQFLLGGIYPTATVVFLLLAVGTLAWPYISEVWESISTRLGSAAAFLVLFLIFGAASVIIWPVEQALATFYRALAAVSLAFFIIALISRLSTSAGSTWSYKRLPLFRNRRWREAAVGYAFVSPWLFGFLTLTLAPMALSLYAAFSHWTLTGVPQFTGLDNYHYMFQHDNFFPVALYNTFWYVIVKTPVVIAASLLLALLMNQKVPGIRFFRTIFYMPTVITGVAAIFLWVWVLWPTGLLNRGLAPIQNFANWASRGHVQSQSILWFFDPHWTKPAMVIMSLWYIGAGALILLASLNGIPQSLYEAADVEGAGSIRKFWNITIPMLSPTLFFLILTNIIGAFQVFNSAYVISTASGVGTNPGDPNQSLLFYEVYMYTKFIALNMGYACALAWFMFVIIMIVTGIQLYLSRRWVYYEGG
jgi:multiple sugar transport system permease protein